MAVNARRRRGSATGGTFVVGDMNDTHNVSKRLKSIYYGDGSTPINPIMLI